ncbi:MAG TPA: ATP synthase F1 subunit delta [Candidatus Limnocylindria bacterium]|nr:ATP synthase F1 subunit delta [Candidatus Limnocylindria bacterium]
MPHREVAGRRAAEAAFELGSADGKLDVWERDLERLRAALANPDLRRLIENPAVSYRDKERVLRDLVEGVMPEALNLVLLMIRRGGPDAVAPMLAHFGALVRRQRHVSVAEVRTALPLDDEQRAAITKRLHEISGDEIQINEVVDDSLIGGISVRIGDQLYDASVRNRLERLRARLTAV